MDNQTWFHAILVNECNQEVTIHRTNVSTFLSSTLISGDLVTARRGPFICSLITFPFAFVWKAGISTPPPPLKHDDGSLLPEAYLHLVRKKGSSLVNI